jgi:hypothetical protein
MTLGCANHSYIITDRDGNTIVSNGGLVAVEYNRQLNEVSTATVRISAAPGCCGQLGNVRSWRHMLNLYRGDQFVWSGFIVSISWNQDEMSLIAVDIVGLLDRRVPHRNLVYNGTDLTVIARELIDDGLAPDDPGHTVTVMGPSGVTGGRSYQQNVGQTADHLRDLADTGIDFTAIGSNVIILPDGFCQVVGAMSDADLPDRLAVAEDGARLITRQIIAGSEESGAIGVAGGIDPYYGLLEQYEEQTTITDQPSADEAARARLASSAVVPVFIDTTSVTLSPDTNVDMRSLIPGWCLDIASNGTCRPISQRLKITGVRVQEDGGSTGSPGQEQITVQVTATGGQLEVA